MVLSRVLTHSGVSIGALVSNVIDARLRISVPVARPPFGITVKRTLPSPSGGLRFGGKKPAKGSSGRPPVAGSMEVNRQVRSPEPTSRLASIRTIRFFSGRKSRVVTNPRDPADG